MIFTDYRFLLDVHEINSQISLSFKQGDTGRVLYITLTENGDIFNIPQGCVAVFTALKPDGTIIFNDCEINGNEITYNNTAQTAAVTGKVDCELRLYGSGNTLITSPHFTIFVHPTVYADQIESKDEINTLTALISETSTLMTSVNEKLSNGDFIPKMEIGTVTTLPAGSMATASFTGTGAAPVLNLGIPMGIQGQAETLIPDTALSLDSTKPVQNKVITEALNNQNASFEEHRDFKENPHGVTKEQVGLGNVDNTTDMDKPVSTAQTAAIKKAVEDHAADKITTADIAEGAVTVTKIATGAIVSSRLGDGAVITAKIANGAVTPAKLSEAIPIANGGTGATSRATAHTNLVYLGGNPVTEATDTYSNWKSLGFGVAYISGEGILKGQPALRGYVYNYTVGGSLGYQVFHECSSAVASIYHRVCVGDDWHADGWIKIWDAKNLNPATLDSNGKVAAAQASANIVSITASTTLSASHCGQFLQANSSSAITITVPDSDAIPVGAEIEILRYGAGAVTIAAASGIAVRGIGSSTTGEKYSITDRYGCAVLKRVGSITWIISGAVEKV